MGLNEIYTHWKDYILNVDFFSDGERIIGRLKLSEAFITCHWAEDEEWLLFRAWDAGTIMSFMKCDGKGVCWVKSPNDVWIKIGTIAKMGK